MPQDQSDHSSSLWMEKIDTAAIQKQEIPHGSLDFSMLELYCMFAYNSQVCFPLHQAYANNS